MDSHFCLPDIKTELGLSNVSPKLKYIHVATNCNPMHKITEKCSTTLLWKHYMYHHFNISSEKKTN